MSWRIFRAAVILLNISAVSFLLLELSVCLRRLFSPSAREKKDLTKKLRACFYGNIVFPEPLKD